jgi:hypothetical protein
MAASITAEIALYLYEKGQIENIISGEAGITSGNLVLWTCRWLIPFVLAFLTISLCNKVNRMVNIVLGAIFTVFNIFQFVMRLATGQELPAFLIIIIISSIVASVLILWYAIRWPKYKD